MTYDADAFERLSDTLDSGMRRVVCSADGAFLSAIDHAEHAQGAMRALIDLVADRSAGPGEGPRLEGVRRNDLAQLLCLVNDRFGVAVKQARATKEERKAARVARKGPKAPVRVLHAVGNGEGA